MSRPGISEPEERVSWQETLFRAHSAAGARGETPCEDQRSHDWLHYLAIGGGTRALVLGAGWGGLPAALSRTCREVLVLDPRPERLALLELRAAQENISNLRAQPAVDLAGLQAQEERFELVVLADFPSRGPASGFRDVLRILAGCAAKGGYVCLPVRNRWGFDRLLGAARARALMPVESYRACRKILEAEGFADAEFYAPLPRPGAVPLFYLPLGHSGIARHFLGRLFPLFEMASPEVKRSHRVEYALARWGAAGARLLRLERTASFFVPGFLVIARKPA